MAETKSARKTANKTANKPAKSTKPSSGFTAEERAAMRARARELKDKTDGETAVRDALAKMSPKDRAIGKRLHEIITATAPDLTPKTWYGMPAYAKDGKVVCFFKNADKFGQRYSTLGFEEAANLDDGAMWPTSYALTELTAADEKKITALVKQAVS